MLPAHGRLVRSLVCIFALSCIVMSAHGAALSFDQELDPWTTGDGAGGDNFGAAIAQDGDWLAVGAPGNVLADPSSLTGISQGTVYLYKREAGGWNPTQTLLQPEVASGATFGLALAMQGDLLVAAAPRSGLPGAVDAGEVHVYSRSGESWQLSASLSSPQPALDGNFGQSVLLLSNDQLLIGAPGETDRGQLGAGAVYLYARQGQDWQVQRRIVASNAEAGARFAEALSMRNGDLLVGAPYAGAGDEGAVDVVAVGSGSVLNRIVSPFSAQGQFGAALASLGATLAVGAPAATITGQDGAGAAAVYRNGSISSPELLNAQLIEVQARFGAALAMDGSRLLIGAPQADVPPGFDEGVIEYYDLAGAIAQFNGSLSNPFPGLSGRLGRSLLVEADGSLLAGADLDKVGPNNTQGSVSSFARQGSDYLAPVRIARGDGAYLERFGSALAMDGEWAVVSSYLERTVTGAEAGAVYLYRRQDGAWQRYQRLESPDPAIEQRFGIAVDLDAEQLLVGAYWDAATGTVDAGAAYLFALDAGSWILQASFRAPTPVFQGHFGFAVALDGDRLLIGEPGADDQAFQQGVAHVYQRSGPNWNIQATLSVPEFEPFAAFGSAVALDGNSALLGGPLASSAGLNEAGAVGRFEFAAGWQFDSKISSPQALELGHFGQSLAMQDGQLAIGAPQESNNAALAAGAIYVQRPGGMLERLVAVDAQGGDRLGSAVALCGTRLISGSPGVDLPGQSSRGAVYSWQDGNGGWQPDLRFLTPQGGGLEGFGLSVACDGELGLAGAPFKAGLDPQEGRVYSFAVGNLFADGFE